MTAEYDVIVVGVGAMGSAALAELADRGACVLGLDRASIPNDSGSSHGVNRIIRLAYAEDPRYVPLLRRAYARWRALEQRAGERLLVITGGIDAGEPGSETVAGSLASVREHDLPHEILGADHGIPGLKIGLYHHRGEVVDTRTWDRDRLRVDPEDEALLRGGVTRYLPDAAGPTLTLKTCLFTNTPDEHFVIDRLPEAPKVVVASPCSGHGFKFASVVGEIVADLALDGGTDTDISMFRLDRFGMGASAGS